MNFYLRKIYALLQASSQIESANKIANELACIKEYIEELETWWHHSGDGNLASRISSSSDRVSLNDNSKKVSDGEVMPRENCCVKHPISGQEQLISSTSANELDLSEIAQEMDEKKVFWWLWRFLPEIQAAQSQDVLLQPAHAILPDCPIHSYQSTVCALTGAMYPEGWQSQQPHEHPYLILFTFSPVQEFIKASRKFVDFWAGSYLLHYLSAKLCWCIADNYGPDAVITPSLWSQEIIDAWLAKEYPDFKPQFVSVDGLDPVARFEDKKSSSLATAGFPNVVTALVPGKDAAQKLGQDLTKHLLEEWQKIAYKVREDIKEQVIEKVKDEKAKIWSNIASEFPPEFQQELLKFTQGGCWEWNKLWEAQIDNCWESYSVAVPLGNPDAEEGLEVDCHNSSDWIEKQRAIACSRFGQTIPADAETGIYSKYNVGSWWGSLQGRLGQLIQAVKNTRNWQLPAAPGERSTLSGRFSAVHPWLHYQGQFREGGGLPEGSMRLFWRVMAEVYPGLFNGSEKLNAIELTKRMAWGYGEVAEDLGIESIRHLRKLCFCQDRERISDSFSGTSIKSQLSAENYDDLTGDSQLEQGEDEYIPKQLDYGTLIRFPNLSSIAAARFVNDNPHKMREYWKCLRRLIRQHLPEYEDNFGSRTRGRPFQISRTDNTINPYQRKGQNYNGVMFSSKWLGDDMGLNQVVREDEANDNSKITTLRRLVEQAHKETGFNDGSPSDWWVIVLADGDNMGKYVSGTKLKNYREYIIESLVNTTEIGDSWGELLDTKKRMGPATHVGLNRALLDFSNRIVPYLTEQRYCGKVVYSGGDDVMAVLPLEDLPGFLRSLRAAWCGSTDPEDDFLPYNPQSQDTKSSGYWHLNPEKQALLKSLPNHPLFTMGEDATMSMGIVIAHKSVPLPTVLENLWKAEKERAKKLQGASEEIEKNLEALPAKDGLCFRVIYGSGNVLEALMKGHLLDDWYEFVTQTQKQWQDLSPLLYRLAEELPLHAQVTENLQLFGKAAQVIINRREESKKLEKQDLLVQWLNTWETWAYRVNQAHTKNKPIGTKPEDLGYLLRFTAFWIDKMIQREGWKSKD